MILEIIGLVFSIILGTIGHFLYELSGKNRFIGFLFSKNESIWEHMKLGITPIILWTLIELFTLKFNNLFVAKFSSIIVFSFILIILYYGYKYIIKKNILFIDILIFYISLAMSYFVSISLLLKNDIGFILNFLSFFGIIFILVLYNIFKEKN